MCSHTERQAMWTQESDGKPDAPLSLSPPDLFAVVLPPIDPSRSSPQAHARTKTEKFTCSSTDASSALHDAHRVNGSADTAESGETSHTNGTSAAG